MVYSCAVFGCLSRKKEPGRSFYSFPKEKKRCRQWLVASCRIDLIDKPEEKLKSSHKICDLHFAESMRYGKKLKCNAVPTLLLPVDDYAILTKSTQTEIQDVQSDITDVILNIKNETTTIATQTTATEEFSSSDIILPMTKKTFSVATQASGEMDEKTTQTGVAMNSRGIQTLKVLPPANPRKRKWQQILL